MMLWSKKAPARMPDFMIIGTQKGGTSTLHNLLSAHPHIYMSNPKELHFFDLNYKKGVPWYADHFAEAAAAQHVGESTPYYLFHPGVPALVAKHMPNCKFVVLLRNPVSRAYSHYQMIKKLGFETAPTFEDALAQEASRVAGEEKKLLADPLYTSFSHQYFSYASRGMYAAQLQRWFKFFKRDQFLVLQSEDFFAQPQAALKKIYQFLGVDEMYPEKFTPLNEGDYAPFSSAEIAKYMHLFAEDQAELAWLLG